MVIPAQATCGVRFDPRREQLVVDEYVTNVASVQCVVSRELKFNELKPSQPKLPDHAGHCKIHPAKYSYFNGDYVQREVLEFVGAIRALARPHFYILPSEAHETLAQSALAPPRICSYRSPPTCTLAPC